KLRHTSDRIHGKTETIYLVLNGQLQRRIDIPLLLVTADMQVPMVCAAVRQPMDEPGVSVEVEDDWLIHSEERIKIPIGQAVWMFRAWLQLEKINHVDVADFEVRKLLTKQRNRSQSFLRRDIAGGRHD